MNGSILEALILRTYGLVVSLPSKASQSTTLPLKLNIIKQLNTRILAVCSWKTWVEVPYGVRTYMPNSFLNNKEHSIYMLCISNHAPRMKMNRVTKFKCFQTFIR